MNNARQLQGNLTDMLDRVFPDYFFKTNPSVLHRKAPLHVALRVLFLQFIIVLIALAWFLWYFSELTQKETLVSSTVKDGYLCEVLRPLTGTSYRDGLGSLNSSENGQFSGSSMNYEECVEYLQSHHVCNHTYDYISVVGIGNSYGSRLFTSGSLLEVSNFNEVVQTQTGQSSSFTRPSVPAANFSNYKQNIYYFIHDSYAYSGKSILNVQNSAYYVIDGTHDHGWIIDNTYLLKVYPYKDKPSVNYSNYNYSSLSVDVDTTTELSSTYYAYQMAVNTGQLFGFNKTSVSNNIDDRHGNGHLLRVDIHQGTAIEWTTPDRYCGNVSLVVSKFIYYHRSDRYFGSCDEYRSSSDGGSYYTVAVFWIDPSVMHNVQVIALNEPIETVNSNNFYFPSLDLLYVDNLHCIDLLTGEVSSVPQPCSTEVSLGRSHPSVSDADIIYFEDHNSDAMYVFNTTSLSYNSVEYYYSLYYMLSYSYALCNGRLEKLFVNVSTDMSYDVLCTEENGFYYQAANVWYPTPMQCATMQPPELLSQCPDVVSNMEQLKADTCSDSITTLCDAAYTLNPPFTCERDNHLTILEILASSFADTQAVKVVVSFLCAVILALWYKSYEPFDPIDENVFVQIDKLKGENRRLKQTLGAVVAHLQKTDGGFKEYDDYDDDAAPQPISSTTASSSTSFTMRRRTDNKSSSSSFSLSKAPSSSSSRDDVVSTDSTTPSSSTSSRIGSAAFYVYNPAHAVWSDKAVASELDDAMM